jgi:hypothetical protein
MDITFRSHVEIQKGLPVPNPFFTFGDLVYFFGVPILDSLCFSPFLSLGFASFSSFVGISLSG